MRIHAEMNLDELASLMDPYSGAGSCRTPAWIAEYARDLLVRDLDGKDTSEISDDQWNAYCDAVCETILSEYSFPVSSLYLPPCNTSPTREQLAALASRVKEAPAIGNDAQAALWASVGRADGWAAMSLAAKADYRARHDQLR